MWSDDAERVVVDVRLPSDGHRRVAEANTPPRVHVLSDHVFLVVRAPEIGQQGHVDYLELDQFIGRRVLVTVHGPLNPVVWLDGAPQETRQVNRRMEAGRLRPTSPVGLRGIQRLQGGVIDDQHFVPSLRCAPVCGSVIATDPASGTTPNPIRRD